MGIKGLVGICQLGTQPEPRSRGGEKNQTKSTITVPSEGHWRKTIRRRFVRHTGGSAQGHTDMSRAIYTESACSLPLSLTQRRLHKRCELGDGQEQWQSTEMGSLLEETLRHVEPVSWRKDPLSSPCHHPSPHPTITPEPVRAGPR